MARFNARCEYGKCVLTVQTCGQGRRNQDGLSGGMIGYESSCSYSFERLPTSGTVAKALFAGAERRRLFKEAIVMPDVMLFLIKLYCGLVRLNG